MRTSTRVYRLLASIQAFALVFAIGFGVVFVTAPTLFRIHFISASAVGSIFVYAGIGAILGWFIPKDPAKVEIIKEECKETGHAHVYDAP